MYLAQTKRWTIERVIRAMAGVFTLAGTGLAAAVSLWWLALPGLVGANLVIFSLRASARWRWCWRARASPSADQSRRRRVWYDVAEVRHQVM